MCVCVGECLSADFFKEVQTPQRHSAVHWTQLQSGKKFFDEEENVAKKGQTFILKRVSFDEVKTKLLNQVDLHL